MVLDRETQPINVPHRTTEALESMDEGSNSEKRIANFLYELGTMRKLMRAHRQVLLTDDMSDSIASHSYRVAMIAWEHDEKNPNHKHQGVESPNRVLKRILALIAQLEKKYRGKKILLVSHGDVLQILHTYASGKPVSHHRLIPHLETAEIRELAF